MNSIEHFESGLSSSQVSHSYHLNKKRATIVICTPFTGQTSKGGIYYALLIRIQNEMCRIISTRNMG